MHLGLRTQLLLFTKLPSHTWPLTPLLSGALGAGVLLAAFNPASDLPAQAREVCYKRSERKVGKHYAHTHKHIYPSTTAQGNSPPPEKPCKAVVSTHRVASPTASVELPLHFARLRNSSSFCGGRRVFVRPWHHCAHRFPLPAEEGVTGLFLVNQFASHHVTHTQSPPPLATTSRIKQGIGTYTKGLWADPVTLETAWHFSVLLFCPVKALHMDGVVQATQKGSGVVQGAPSIHQDMGRK